MIYRIAGLLSILGLVSMIEVLPLLQQRRFKEIGVYLILMGATVGIALSLILDLHIATPADVIEMVIERILDV